MKTQILSGLDDLIATLEQPLSPAELANGWTMQCQVAILSLLRDLRDSVSRDGALPELSIGRGLDHWGVERGPLFEKACAISNRLDDLVGN
jgi:hypothetical protein